jgi:hypothetical protein
MRAYHSRPKERKGQRGEEVENQTSMRPGNIFEAPAPQRPQDAKASSSVAETKPTSTKASGEAKIAVNSDVKTTTPTSKPWPDLARLADALVLVSDEPWPGSSAPPDLKPNYSIYNPSICIHPTKPDRMLVVLRSANYAVTDDWRYVVQTGEKGVMTDNYLAEIDVERTKEGKTMFHHRGRIVTPTMPFPNSQIGGFEDVRLQWEPISRRMFATFTSLEMEARGMPAISLTELDLERNVMSQPVLLRGPQPAKPKEKNWMSFTLDGRLLLIYSINPLVVLECDPKTGNCPTIQNDAPVSGVPSNHWRGSSPLCPLPTSVLKFLATASADGNCDDIKPSKNAKRRRQREAQRNEANERYFIALGHTGDWPRYAQIFLVFRATRTTSSAAPPSETKTTAPAADKWTLKLTHYSTRFIFERHDIEYSLGLAITPNAKEFILPYSIRDRICRCARIEPHILLPRLHCVS